MTADFQGNSLRRCTIGELKQRVLNAHVDRPARRRHTQTSPTRLSEAATAYLILLSRFGEFA
jgi:hypothetical protein